ncbi:hypothetical protein [Emticicia sp.]|uniref:hypothetical protein n=1 Tax=Emticicia sp. TaxID=1930953 RepID=UPI003752BF29
MFTFDDSPVMYLVFGNLLLILAGCLSLYSFFDFKKAQNRTFIITAIGLCSLTIVILRLPAVVFNQAFNLDESVFIVGAMTLAQDPIYWESVDGCTSGPLNFYIITFFCQVFNQPYDYISARIVGITLMVGSVVFSFLALRKLFSTAIAFSSIFPAVAFLSTTRYLDFIHFSSEHLPIFLLSIMAYLYATINNQISIKSFTVFILGLVAGTIIFTKLQAIPIAMFLTLSVYWLIYQKDKHDYLKKTFWLTFGVSIIPFCLILIAFWYNFVDKIWVYYIQNNLSYGENSNIFNTIYKSFFDDINVFIRLITVLSVVLLSYHWILKRRFQTNPQSLFICAFLISTLLSVYKTGFVFHHYLLLLVFPTVFLYAFFLKDLLSLSQRYLSLGFLSIVLIVVLSKTLIYPFKNHFVTTDKSKKRPLPISTVGKQIVKYSKPNEALVVWGESGQLYLETKRTQGIRWSNSHWGMYSDSLQKFFQQEYVKEFREHPFPVFIDAHATKKTFMTRDKCGFETNEALKKMIDDKYKFVGEFDEHRVYVRKERFEEITSL